MIFGILIVVFLVVTAYCSASWIGIELMGFSRSPISPIMLAIIFGVILGNCWSFSENFQKGFIFCASAILKLGIVFLGLRLSLTVAGDIGLKAIPLIAVCIAFALAMVLLIGKKMDLSWRLSALIAVGTSICGSTAICATAPLIRSEQAETSYAIATITIFGLFAMFAYPFISHMAFDGDAVIIGYFLGASIHETAQVAGAGFIYQQQYQQPMALDIATLTKLMRNLSMVLVIPLLGIWLNRRSSGETYKATAWYHMVPLFIIGFALMVAIRTIGDMGDQAFGFIPASEWQALIGYSSKAAKWCLTAAMAGIGLTTNIKLLCSLGLKPFVLGFVSATAVGGVAMSYLNMMALI